MAFNTLSDILTQARVLLQDEAGVRYPDSGLVQNINEAILETARIRPDLYRDYALNQDFPQYDPSQTDVAIDYPLLYRPALVNYIVGRAQMQDSEESTDARAVVFLNSFLGKLLTSTA